MEAHPSSARDRGVQLLKAGSIAEGIEWLEQARAESPSDVELYLYLGLAYAKMNEPYRTVDILERAADVAPTSAKVHYNLGVAYHKVRNLTFAREEYLRALGCDPGYMPAKQALDVIAGERSSTATPLGGDEADGQDQLGASAT